MLTDYKDTGLPSYDIDLEEAPEDRWTGHGGEAERENLESLWALIFAYVFVKPSLRVCLLRNM